MGLREKFETKIKSKELEIQELESRIREAKSYLQALHDSIKILPREEKVTSGSNSTENMLRPNSSIYKTYELLKKVGRPLRLEEILKGIGKGISKKERVSLSGSLGWYVRKEEIFTRPAPNTFGLIGMENTEEPPEDFGISFDAVKEEDVPF